MIIFAFVASAAVTGALLALLARTQGIDHTGILVAIGIIGAGVQMGLTLAFYLRHTSAQVARRNAEPLPEMQEPNSDRIHGR